MGLSTAASYVLLNASCTDGLFLHFVRISVCIVYFIVLYVNMVDGSITSLGCSNKRMTSGR